MKILGNIGFGFLVTAAVLSLIAGTAILVESIASNYVFNVEYAKLTAFAGFLLTLFYFIGDVSKRELAKIRGNNDKA